MIYRPNVCHGDMVHVDSIAAGITYLVRQVTKENSGHLEGLEEYSDHVEILGSLSRKEAYFPFGCSNQSLTLI